jgi:ribose-phosphate pyrophosphokinase
MPGAEKLIFAANSNIPLAEKICQHLNLKLSKAMVTRFSDGETRVEIEQNVRGRDVFIIQSTSNPVNENIMEALILTDACKRASAQRITLVTPYFGYARQERKSAPRTPITAKLVADIFTVAGIDRLLVLELHAAAIQGFFNIPVDHLFTKPIFGPYFEKLANPIVISPDAGGVERARAMAKYLDCGLAIIDKRRDRPNESEVMHIIGEVKGKNCLIIDDICDTGGSLVKAAQAVLDKGALSVQAAITHPVLSGSAVSKIGNSALSEIVVTDTIPLTADAKNCAKIKQLTVAGLLAEAIERIHHSDSVSSLFV